MERNRRASVCGLMMSAGLLLAAPAWADEAAQEPEEQLKTSTVQVTASRVERELLQVPMSVSVITAEDIRKSPATTVGGLLKDVPGVEIANTGAQGLKRISIRGESPHRTLILIDGQKIAENKSMEGTPLMIDPAIIERIEVIRGPASVLYGSEAMGGVINIITKKGGSKPIQGEAGTTFTGATEGVASHLSLYGGIGGFNYRLFGSYSDQGDLRGATGTMHNTAFRTWSGSAYLGYDFEKLSIGGGVEHYDSMVKAGDETPGYENFSVDMDKWDREKYYAFAEFKDIANFLPKLRFDGFYQTNEKHMFNHVDIDPALGMPLVLHNEADNKNEQFGFSLQSDWQIGDNHYLILGYEYNRDKLDATTNVVGEISATRLLQIPTFAAIYNSLPTFPPAIRPMWIQTMLDNMNYSSTAKHNGTTDTHALYAQMESTLPADFTLNYGVRQTWVRSKMTTAHGWRTTTATGAIAPMDAGAEETTSDSKPVFNVGLVWTGIENLSLRAQFAQGFRTPTLQERFLISAMGGGTMIPNPMLDPETSNNYEIGLRYTSNNLMLDLAFFYSEADDYIATATIDAASNTSQYINVASAKTHGVELSVSYDLPYGFTPYVTGTWMRRKYDYGNSTTWNTGTPEWRGRAGLRFVRDISPEATFYADAYGRFSSPMKQEDAKGEISTQCNNWATANLAFGVDFGKEKEYSAGIEVLNITNERYYLSQGLQEAGMHVNARFSLRF